MQGHFQDDTLIFVCMSGTSVLVCIAIAVLDARKDRTLRRRPSADITTEDDARAAVMQADAPSAPGGGGAGGSLARLDAL